MEKTLQKVKAVKDDSCHWYVIPFEKSKQFFKDCESNEMADSGEFDDKWGKYRTGGDLNLIQLWAEL